MGNASSNPNTNRPLSTQKPRSPSPTNLPHRSLRTKKKSLELPDLASLGLTPAIQQHYRSHPRTSSPIPIPVSPQGTRSRGPTTVLPSTDAFVDQPAPQAHRGRNPHFRGAPLQYNSTRSFTHSTQPQTRMQQFAPMPPPFVQETVHSTIPIALAKATGEAELTTRRSASGDEPSMVTITWHGGGNSVILARAGDDDWKGRQPMERESPTSDTWHTTVSLLPGTHHIRFLVDDTWRLADDLPTAVDDQGSLANYVAVALFAAPASASPRRPPPVPAPAAGQSFWSASTDDTEPPPFAANAKGATAALVLAAHWTSEFPEALLAAAREEEQYLAASASPGQGREQVPAPNIPPAPGLPRHLDKLILNARMPGVGGSPGRGVRSPGSVGSAGSGGSWAGASGRRERERGSGGRRERERKSMLGLGSTVPGDDEAAGGAASSMAAIPVTTASGTDVSATMGDRAMEQEIKERQRARLEGTGLGDDASVLPVPSHVVLHHLSTSAIKNGVLAVANTTRYRKKYLTTIYYKST